MIVWLETSAVVALAFGGADEVSSAAQILTEQAPGAERRASSYVLFELARGYLSYFIGIHNEALRCQGLGELHRRSYTGQRIMRAYERSAWLEAFTEYLHCIDGQRHGEWGLDDLREKVWTKIRRGWRRAKAMAGEGGSPCRADLDDPAREEARGSRVIQELPLKACGTEGACGILRHVQSNDEIFRKMIATESDVPGGDRKEKERKRRITALRLLLDSKLTSFKRWHCYKSADAIIAHEAIPHAVATKDGDLERLCRICGTGFVHLAQG